MRRLQQSVQQEIQENQEANQSRKSKERWGIAYIYSSYNNTFVHITDITGTETIALVSGGQVVNASRLESSPAAAIKIVKKVADLAKQRGITGLHVKVRAPGGHNGPMSPGKGSQTALKQLSREGFRLGVIEDVTPFPTDSCRKKGGARKKLR